MKRAEYIRILDEEFNRLSKNRDNFTYAEFAKKMGITKGMVSSILAGRRIPSIDLAEQMVVSLKLPPTRARRFFYSIGTQKNLVKKRGMSEKLQEVVELGPVIEIPLASLMELDQWYYYAIMTLCSQKKQQKSDSRSGTSLRQIVKQTGLAVDVVTTSLTKLVSLGMVSRDQDGNYSTIPFSIRTPQTSESREIRAKITRQVVGNTYQSFLSTHYTERLTNWMYLALDPSRLPEVRGDIQRFLDRLEATYGGNPENPLFQLALLLTPTLEKVSAIKVS